MQRYFFDIASNKEVFPDVNGVELASDAAAHSYAMKLVAKTIELDPDQRDWRGWRIDVLDAGMRLVFTVLYPGRGPATRKTFGKRNNKPLNLLDVLCVACGSVVLALDVDAWLAGS